MRLVFLVLSGWVLTSAAWAAGGHSEKEILQDIERHRAMAAAHQAAAACLESGKKSPEACVKDLQASCKGLGIGKYCGLKHEH